MGILSNDSTQVGYGDNGVQLQATEAGPNGSHEKPKGASGQVARYGGQNHRSRCDK
jgi:hypothetical protein